MKYVTINTESHVVGDASLSIMAVNPGETSTPTLGRRTRIRAALQRDTAVHTSDSVDYM